jgi:MoaA/NifB/PqqE/SkfB family radical SAM enzyme
MSLLPPLLLHYYITYRCNCRCRFCTIWKTDARTEADPAVVRLRLHQAKQLGVRFVDFTGGEPLLHPYLPEMLTAAKEVGLKTTLTTNALLYPQRAHELAGLVDFMHFSIDAAEADLHNRLRGADAFAAVLNSLDLARSMGEKPDMTFTVTGENLLQLAALSDIAEALSLILVVNPVFGHEHQLSPAALDFIERFCQHPYVYINRAFHRLRRQGGNQTAHPRCRVMDAVLVILPDDRLATPCFHFSQDIRPISHLADMRQEAWFKNMQKQQGRFADCQGCDLNCYFDPSFMYGADYYFFQSVQAKARYAWFKYVKSARPATACAQTVFSQRIKKT